MAGDSAGRDGSEVERERWTYSIPREIRYVELQQLPEHQSLCQFPAEDQLYCTTVLCYRAHTPLIYVPTSTVTVLCELQMNPFFARTKIPSPISHLSFRLSLHLPFIYHLSHLSSPIYHLSCLPSPHLRPCSTASIATLSHLCPCTLHIKKRGGEGEVSLSLPLFLSLSLYVYIYRERAG